MQRSGEVLKHHVVQVAGDPASLGLSHFVQGLFRPLAAGDVAHDAQDGRLAAELY